jgi:uncharacterized protein (TIGR03437 family)
VRYAIVSLLFSAALFGQPQRVPYGDFEGAVPGQPPPGWGIGGSTIPGFQAVLTNQGCVEGSQCAVLTAPPDPPANTYGDLSTSVLSNTYPASKIRLRAAVRVQAGTQANLWLRVDRRGGPNGFFFSTTDPPITSSQWAYYTIDAPIVSDDVTLYFGLIITSGTAWLDDVTIEVLTPPRTESAEAPRPLSDQGLANLVAFAKLAGYVRYFHPSDQSYQAEWDDFVINGVRAVENAVSPDDLARKLQTLFDPIAPNVQVFNEGAPPDLPPDLRPASLAGLSVTQWFHNGLGFGTDNAAGTPYGSQRESAPVSGQWPYGFASPAQPYAASLGNGLTARVPVALYTNGQGTLPSRPSAAPTDNLIRNVADRGTRLADVILAWNVFQHFYPYFDLEQVDMPGELRRALTSAALNTGPDDFLVTMQKLVASLKDGMARVSYDGMVRLHVPLIWAWVEGQLIVTTVKQGQATGILPGDRILTIDGRNVDDVMAQQAPLESGATPQYVRLRTLQDITICNPGTDSVMQLQIEPFLSLGNRRTVQLSCGLDTNWQDARPTTNAQLGPGLLYIDLSRITVANLARVMPQLQTASGIVFDYRGYPAQLPLTYLENLTTTTLQSEIFLFPTPTLPDQTQMTFARFVQSLYPQTPYLPAKLVFLIDEQAIYRAESEMDIVEHYKMADFVGAPTAGTTGEPNPFTLPGGFHVQWTGMKVLKPDGSRFNGVGIRPTVPVSRTRQGIANRQDEILQRGWQLIMGPQAGPTPAITAAGIVNSASFVGGTVARGEIVAIFGTNLASSPVQGTYDESGFLTKYLGETRVFFDGIQAPLTYVSSTQINAIVPYGVNANTVVTVEYQLRSSNPVTLQVAPSAPGIFAHPGKSQAVIANSDGSLNSDTNPAKRGDWVALFATGEGQTVPQGVDGVLPAPGKWPSPQGDLEVQFGGIHGDVIFKGVVYAGVLQVNVWVPTGAPAGNAVPLVLSVGGVPNTGTLTIALK